jgi:hypothetical protein
LKTNNPGFVWVPDGYDPDHFHVMGIATYGFIVFSSMKQILNDVHDADVFVVTLFRKQ